MTTMMPTMKASGTKPLTTKLGPAISMAEPDPKPVPIPAIWQGPDPMPLATDAGLRYPYRPREYAQVLSSYFLMSAMPKGVADLLFEEIVHWPPSAPVPPPSKLVVPRIRVFLEETSVELDDDQLDEIERLLSEAAAKARKYRPDWSERLLYYRKQLHGTRS